MKKTVAKLVTAIIFFLAIVLALIIDYNKRPKYSREADDLTAFKEVCDSLENKNDQELLFGRSIGYDMNEQVAMNFLFANYDPINKISKLCPSKNSKIYDYLNHKSRRGNLETAPVFSAHYFQSGEPHFIMIMQAKLFFQSCHACTVVIGAAIFYKRKDLWHLKALNQAVTAAGSYGEAPTDMSLVQIGPSLYGVAVRDGYQSTGQYAEVFFLIGPVGDRIGELLLIDDFKGKDLNCIDDVYDRKQTQNACWAYSSSIAFSPAANSQYFDIKVNVEGMKYATNDKLIPFKNQNLYSFNGCKYYKDLKCGNSIQKSYFIQVGAFSKYKSACERADFLIEKGYPVYCDFHNPDERNSIFRVRIVDSRRLHHFYHIISNT
jgi:hypothetical protein